MENSMTDVKDKIEQLVYAYDLSTLGVEAILPDEVKVLELSEQLLTEHLPSLEQRADLVAYSACYYSYLNQNPNGTRDEFNTLHNPEALEQVSVSIQNKLNSTLDTKVLLEFHRKNSPLPTRIDINRQVKK